MGQIVSDVTDILDNKSEKQKVKSERKEVLKKIAADETEKNNLVKKVLATQRAKYGASGMNTKGLTEENALKRLKNETEQPYEAKKKSNVEKLNKIKTKKTNLLESFLKRFDRLVG
ncbi:MAG: hypothetical protein K5912_04045 [Alphaproteobacteria bacterium]|nr:hypothetical protein [Alphaproteobacteria bacterium]